jgi:hypothetical protein
MTTAAVTIRAVTVPVPLDALHEQIADVGPAAHLVTVGEHGAPHVVSVLVTVEGDRLVTEAGRTTGANAAASPSVSLLWAALPRADYSLIVDGTAEVAEGTLSIRPTRAVLHRVATATGEGPSCITVL